MSPPLLIALLACSGVDPEASPEPGPLMAGIAQSRIPAPVGIGTAGNSPFDTPSSDSPFSEIYPATRRLHGHPEIKVVALSRGEGFELIFVRLDTVGVFQQMRRALVLELQQRLGRDLDDALIMGATHTHSGPGRVLDAGGMFDLIADRFFPEFYVAFLDAMADTVEQALTDLQPARVGHVMASCSDAHSDRRCEDGLDYENPLLPVIAVEREGQIDAVVMSYAVHGTVMSIDDLTLGQDVSGAIEEAVEDRFDHPVEALMFNAWGADMAPQDPGLPTRTGGVQPEGYDKMDGAGLAVADAVEEALETIAWENEPTLGATTSRVYIDRDIIGYEEGEFDYEYGGVYCEGEDDCDPETFEENLDSRCIPFTADYPAPTQTVVTAGQVGELFFITWPGEAGTLLAEALIGDIRERHEEVEDLAFFGYAQDYLGYSLLEEDWWQGGYEASGALWGPRQGEHLRFWNGLAFGTYMKTHIMGIEPDPILPFDDPLVDPYVPETPVAPGTLAQDVETSLGPQDLVEVAVYGRDAWLGTPLATLQTASGEPVLRPNGTAIDSDGSRFWIDHAVEPSYEDEEQAAERTFVWKFSMPVQKPTEGAASLTPGDYQLQIALPTEDGTPQELTSSVFTVTSD